MNICYHYPHSLLLNMRRSAEMRHPVTFIFWSLCFAFLYISISNL